MDLSKDFSLSLDDITDLKQKGMIYSSLHTLRMANMEQIILSRLKKVRQLENMHYRTIACIDTLKNGDKAKVLTFFEELNGLGLGGAFEDNQKKEERNNRREWHLKKLSNDDKKKRFSKVGIYTDDEKMKLEMSRVREMLQREGSSLYQILGIPQYSSQYQILNTIRKLSKAF